MSGVAGILMRTGEPADPELVEEMAAATPYRARDGVWAIRSGCFSAIRLQTVTTVEDESEQSPVRDADSGLVLVFDGRIDNREDLAEVLSIRRSEGMHKPDAWYALQAIRAWGDAALGRLVGDFAFACWNPSDRSLFCARDAMGIRPFFYWCSERAFVFGSELRQLLAHPMVPRAPDERMVAGLLAGSLGPVHERTLYRDIRRLPHAHSLTVSPSTLRLSRYWRADSAEELRLRDEREYAEGLRELLDRSVAARVRSRGGVGAYLSGGLDSSSVVVTARATRPDVALTTFSLIFPSHAEADERAYSQSVVRRVMTPSVQLPPPPYSREAIDAQAEARLELPDFPHDYAGTAVRQAMATHGLRVALTGTGGDIGLSGSLFHYADLLRRGRVIRFLKRYRDAARQPAMGWMSADILACGVWPLLPYRMRLALRPAARRLRRLRPPRWIAPGLAERAGVTAVRPLRRIAAGRLARTDVADGFENGWIHMALDMYQRGSLEYAIEDRHPFLDRRVVEFAVALPDDQRWQNGRTRDVLRRAMDARLPETVRDRPDAGKGDFSHLYPAALEALGGKGFFSDALSIARIEWVDPKEARSMYDRMQQLRNEGAAAYGDVAFRLWVIAAIEKWYSAVFEGAGRQTWSRSRGTTRSTLVWDLSEDASVTAGRC